MRYLKYEMGSGYKNTQNSEVGHLFANFTFLFTVFPPCVPFPPLKKILWDLLALKILKMNTLLHRLSVHNKIIFLWP